MKLQFSFLLLICTVLIGINSFAGEPGPPVNPDPEKEKAAEPAEKEWAPPTEKKIAALEKAEKKKLDAKVKRWRERLEATGVPPEQVERKLAEAKKRWKREMRFKIELAKLPPEMRDEAIIEHRLKEARTQLEKQGLSGETLEKELAEARDRIQLELEERHKMDALPLEEKKKYLLKKREENLRQRLAASGLQGEELERVLKKNMELYRQEIEQQLAEEKPMPKRKAVRVKKAKLTKKDLAQLEKLQETWQEDGLSDEDIEKRSAQWKRRRLLEKANPGLAVARDLRKDVKSLQKQLRVSNRRLVEVSELVKKQSEEIAALKKMLEEIHKMLIDPDWEEPEELDPLPEPLPGEPEPGK